VITGDKWTQEMIDECEREAEELLAVFGEFVNASIAPRAPADDLSKLTADLFHDGEPLAPMCESLQKHGRCNS
jgi:hypothetical protein